MKHTKLVSLFLVAVLFAALMTACGSEPNVTEPATKPASETVTEPATEETSPIRISVLSGTTGYGMVKLIQDAKNGTSEQTYDVTVETTPKTVQDLLISGEVDIAALPTNKAANLYNATGGKIKVVAVNTLGVMYLISADGDAVNTVEELRGKTVGIPQEPSYLLTALCTGGGLEIGKDVTVETYAAPAELLKAFIAGTVKYAVLPEPLVSTATAKKAGSAVSLNLTEAWEDTYPESQVMQGCIVVRSAWADAHPDTLNAFLSEYEASVQFVNENPDTAAVWIETEFGTAKAVAAAAIPRCNLVYLAGAEMKTAFGAYLKTLEQFPDAGIGGTAPDDGFYWTEK